MLIEKQTQMERATERQMAKQMMSQTENQMDWESLMLLPKDSQIGSQSQRSSTMSTER